jgi:hypothetical protein
MSAAYVTCGTNNIAINEMQLATSLAGMIMIRTPRESNALHHCGVEFREVSLAVMDTMASLVHQALRGQKKQELRQVPSHPIFNRIFF